MDDHANVLSVRTAPIVGMETGDVADDRVAADVSVDDVCVGIATRGRPDVVRQVLEHLRHQTLQPASVIVACTSPADVGDLADPAVIVLVVDQPGLTRQRNGILRNLPDSTGTVVFFDDDFVPHPGWLNAVVETFRSYPDVGCVTGHVIADGIKGPGLSFEEAAAAFAADRFDGVDAVAEDYSPYGCNMAFRRTAIDQLRFDERLVLYGWLEDRDFGGALAMRGWRLLKIGAARGVHLGIKKGRISGHRLGYSQVMNPAYLSRKGTITASAMVRHVYRNVIANLARSFSPEPFIDRRGRLRGNAIAALDLLRGRLTPERAEHL